jgi:hypothetical protein
MCECYVSEFLHPLLGEGHGKFSVSGATVVVDGVREN